MELSEALERRHMTRSFDPRTVDPALVEQILRDSLRAPTAGNTQGVAWVVLSGSAETGPYWSHTTTEEWRAGSNRWPGLSRAPVVALSLASPARYVERYGEPDKVSSGLGPAPDGGGQGAWSVPYWFADAAFATMATLLGATSAGLGACFLGNFRGEDDLAAEYSIPPGWRLFGSVLLGYPDGHDHPSPSLRRTRLRPAARLHWGHFDQGAVTD